MADLEKAIEEVEALVTTYADNTQYDAFRLILSANREMREQVEFHKRRVERRDEKINRMRAAYNRLLADTDPTPKARSTILPQTEEG